MRWVSVNIVPLLNIAGIIFDIIGAFLVAAEVVNQFRDKQYRDQITFDPDVSLAPTETDQYKKWAHTKMLKMKIGLAFLVLGFVLQLMANAFQFRSAA
jgi:hypothetical protein